MCVYVCVNACIHVSATVAETVATGCEVTMRCHGNRAGSLCLIWAGRKRAAAALPIQAGYVLEERWVDETRDFLSSSSSSSTSPALLCSISLPSYVSEISSGRFLHKHLSQQPLARQGRLSACFARTKKKKKENLYFSMLFCQINTRGG